MVNPVRGEAALETDAETYPMRLSLGALADLETKLGAEGLIGLAERFESGTFGGQDLIALLGAGLRGCGMAISDSEVSELNFKNGVIGAAEAASALLAVTFRGVGE